MYSSFSIDFVTLLEAMLTRRQPRDKLQCLYENPMSNDFRKMPVLKKNMNCKLFYSQIFGAVKISPDACESRFSVYSEIKRTLSRVPKLTSYISLYNEPLFSRHLY